MASKGSTTLNTISTTPNVLDGSEITSTSKTMLLESAKEQGYTIEGYETGEDYSHGKVTLKSPDGITVEFTNEYIDTLSWDLTHNYDYVHDTVSDLLRYVNEAPDLLKQHSDHIIFDKITGDFMTEYGYTENKTGIIHIGMNTIDKQDYNSPQNTLYHEMAHNVEYHPKLHSIPEMTWFKKISMTEKSSGYANAYFQPNSEFNTEYKYSENWADALKMVAMSRVNPSYALVSDPKGNQNSKPITYTEWKKLNPNLDKVANKILDCKNDDEIFDTVKEFYYEWDRPNKK